MGSFIYIFGFVTLSIPSGLAVYHYAILKGKGNSQNQDCCCKAEKQNSCSSCTETCKKEK